MPKLKTVTGYKGFDQDLKCRDKKYEVGKTYTHKGDVKLCEHGLHFVENPLDVFSYYPAGTSRFAQVEASGVSKETADDSKRVAKKLTISAEINLHSLIDAGLKFILDKVDFKDGVTNDEDGKGAQNSTKQKSASNSGVSGAASNSGDYGAASNSGGYGAASNSGYRGAASNSGVSGAASNSGGYGAASNSGKEGVAVALGIEAKAKASKGTWITLAEWKQDEKYDWHRVDVQTIKVDGKKIKANTFYSLVDGEFVEAKE